MKVSMLVVYASMVGLCACSGHDPAAKPDAGRMSGSYEGDDPGSGAHLGMEFVDEGHVKVTFSEPGEPSRTSTDAYTVNGDSITIQTPNRILMLMTKEGDALVLRHEGESIRLTRR